MDEPVTGIATSTPGNITPDGAAHEIFSPAERDMLVRMGIALVGLWSELPRDIQRVLFEAAAGQDKNPDGGLREEVARFLHATGNPHNT